MHDMKLKLPSDVVKHLAQEADSLGLTYSKHLLATLDAMATIKSKELIKDEYTRKRSTIN